MSFLLKPLSGVMKRLSFPVKFALVAAAFIIPLVVTSALLLINLQRELQLIHLEQRGADYAAALSRFLSALQEDRAVQSAVLNGDSGRRAAAAKAAAEVDHWADEVDAAEARNPDFGLGKDWKDVRDRWAELKKDLPDDSERASASAHAALAESVTGLLSTLGDKSNLTLDPVIDTFYLQDTLLQRLPALSEAVGQSAAVAQGIATRKKLDSDEHTKLLMLASSAFAAMEATTKGLDNVFATSDQLKQELGPSYDGIAGLGAFFAALKQKVLADAVTIEPSAMYGLGSGAMDKIHALASAIPERLSQLLENRADSLRRQRNVSLGVSIGSLLLAAWLLWGFSISVRRSLVHAGEVAAGIAAGRLDNTIDTGGRDEVARVLQSLEAMQTDLRSRAVTIRASSDQIGSVAQDMARGNHDLARRTEMQASSLEETASTLTEFTRSVTQTAADAARARELTTATSALAMTGGQTVREVVTSMDKISGSSQRIREITSLIDSIAFQTNILALNAAVEAARAGEQGRGFAVVAAEVRNLAQRTSSAAKEIAGLVGQSVQEVDAGARLVGEAGEQVSQIVESVQQVTDIISRIANASAEQTNGIAQVNAMMKKIDAGAVTEQNEALIAQAASASQRLERQAASLVEAVSVFQLGAYEHELELARQAEEEGAMAEDDGSGEADRYGALDAEPASEASSSDDAMYAEEAPLASALRRAG
jgi:methyl-accepting chemotaxis protein